MSKKAIIIGVACAAAVAAACGIFAARVISDNKKNVTYLEGMEAYSNGDYAAAREAFESIGDYQDTEAILKEIDYQQAISMIGQGEDEKAEAVLLEMKDYKDAESYLYLITYHKLQAAMEAEDYDLAEQYADEITGYEDVEDIKQQIKYHQAIALIDELKFDEATALLMQVQNETLVQTAQNMMTYTEYAVPALQDLYTRYPDESAQITDVLEARLRKSAVYGSSLEIPVIMIRYQVTTADGAVEELYAAYNNFSYYGACHSIDKNNLDMSNQSEMLGYLKIEPNWDQEDTILLSAPALKTLAGH